MTATMSATLTLWQHIYGEQTGYLCLFSGQRAAPDEQRLDDPRQEWYRWPNDADRAETDLLRLSAMGRETYTCAHLLTERVRSAKTAAPVWTLYADLDGAPVPATFPQPTALVESSPERHQGYWRLTRGLPPEQAEALNQRLTRAIGADPSGYDLTQVLRPPGTTSYKRAAPFVVRLVHLDAARTVDPDELARLLPPLPTAPPARPPHPTTPVRPTGEAAALLHHALETDAKFRRLDDGDIADYTSQSQADAAYCCKAIWWTDHDLTLTDSWFRRSRLFRNKWDEVHFADGSTYGAKTIERADGFVQGGYRRALGLSANGQSVRSNNQPLDETPDPETGAPATTDTTDKPTLDAQDEHLSRITRQAWEALAAGNDPPYLFRHAGTPARLERDAEGHPFAVTLTEDRLVHESSTTATWFKQKRSKPELPPVTVHALPPVRVIRNMLATPFADQPLPILTAITAAPSFAADGSLHVSPGYHPAGRTYFAPAKGFVVPPVPPRPTAAEIACARTLLCDELLGDFPFTGPAELAHAVGVMLLSFGRSLIDGPTPLHLLEKPSPGTGATLLADVLLYPATGRTLAALTEGRDEEEWRKRLTAVLRTSPPAIMIDNLKERLDTAALAAILTTSEHEDRILGTSDIVRIPVRAVWLASGNNPTLSNEITRRTVRIRLDAHQERPWLRQGFRQPRLQEWVREQRRGLCQAALTLIMAWLAEGKPRAEDAPRLGMYENWSRTIGGILDVAGIPGFLGNLADQYAHADAESDDARILIEAWWKEFQNRSIKAAELFPLVIQHSIPVDLGSGSDRAQRTRFGQTLTRLRDRRYTLDTGRTVIVLTAGKRQGAQLWELREESEGDTPS